MPLSGERLPLRLPHSQNRIRKIFEHSTDSRSRVAILLAFVIYGAAAKVIYDKREHLKGFLNPLNENPFVNTITTEVTITTEECPIIDKDDYKAHRPFEEIGGCAAPPVENPYSVDIQVSQQQPRGCRPLPFALRMRTITRQVAKHETNADAWLYARVAFLFFLALLITWVCNLLLAKKPRKSEGKED